MNNLFITGKFNIPAQQYIAEPHQRIEPMSCQQQETEWLPPMILAADMRLLMGNYMIHLAAVHMIREVDFGSDDSQHKRGANLLALIDVAPQDYRFADLAAQTPVTHSRVEEKGCYSEKPNPR